MEIIAHRINTIDELKSVPAEFGVELDLRDNLDGSIYIQHNPFEPGENFEEYLQDYHHETMILNIKSERIEYKVLELIKKYDVKKYFFLDSSFPMIKVLSDEGEKNIALRFSEYEGLDTLRLMQGRVDWVWVDTFSKIPLTKEVYTEIKGLGYKLCFVSPELQGQPEKIEEYIEEIRNSNYSLKAVCTKLHITNRWMKAFNLF